MASSPSSTQAADAVKQRAECLGLLGIWSHIVFALYDGSCLFILRCQSTPSLLKHSQAIEPELPRPKLMHGVSFTRLFAQKRRMRYAETQAVRSCCMSAPVRLFLVPFAGSTASAENRRVDLFKGSLSFLGD